ncbi:hypothetical protein [Natrinema salaciae]|uniref:Uncharacterized protein n=1 Tax=Natrinema salaciae TaxID=1186196 RepID=A0A1H9EIL4_9EURY|nr:hypothetical protein [Natrinema salaciae]SEQ25397.1 hypothetical protein SAMN04489841_1301 [Natrinema salaciae]
MPSAPFSRRRLLTAGGGCLSTLSLAGCAETRTSGSASESVDGGTVESTHEYESLSVRSAENTVFVYPNDDAAADTGDGPESQLNARFLVIDSDAASAMRIDGDATDARAFVEATDFDRESVFVDQRSIDDCYRRHLLGVRAHDDSVRTDYCRELKAPTTPCEAEKTVMEAVFVRINRPYEDHPSSRASSESGSCPARTSSSDETAANDTREPDGRNETNGVSRR